MNYLFLQCRVTFSDTIIQMGLLPADSLVLNPFLVVPTAFNAGGNDLIRIGTALDDDAFGTDHNVASQIINPTNFAAGAALGYYAAGTKIIATYGPTGGAPTTGSAIIILPFLRIKPS